MENNPVSEKRPLIARIFFPASEPRLRAGWRLLIQAGVYILFTICLSLPVVIWLFVTNDNLYSVPNLLFTNIPVLASTTLSVFLARKFLDKRPIPSLGLKIDRRALSDVFAGIFITGLMMGLIYLLEWAAGWLKFEGFAWEDGAVKSVIGNTIMMLFIFIIVGWNEELLFRGYRMQALNAGLNPAWGLALSSAWFGIAHILNPNASWLAIAGIYLAGLFLAFGYLRTRQLWLPIGLHIGWNFFEGPIFGFPVSGQNFFTLPRVSNIGPVPWTGGAFGPEAGLILVPALLLGVVLVLLYTHKRKAVL